MTDAEAIELVAIWLGLGGDAMVSCTTVIFGYLLMAYYIGKRLTVLQNTIITALFLVFAGWQTYGMIMYFDRAAQLTTFVSDQYRSPHADNMAWLPGTSGVIFSLILVACLKFMWDIRHSKTE